MSAPELLPSVLTFTGWTIGMLTQRFGPAIGRSIGVRIRTRRLFGDISRAEQRQLTAYELLGIVPQCTTPPPGWWCSRDADHDGPCAARPLPKEPLG